VMAAIAAAVHRAIGKRFYSLPMSPPVVSAALEG
jgi:CO/xanthine dehydrogenase Mo-binding subunit